jgi:tetratricopeptide (TPR) repeat protein
MTRLDKISMLLLFLGMQSQAMEFSGLDKLIRNAGTAYREGRFSEALRDTAQVLEMDPQNAAAKNHLWRIVQAIREKRSREALRPDEKDQAVALARRYLDDRRQKTEAVLGKLRDAARRTGDLRSPSGLFASLSQIDPDLEGAFEPEKMGGQAQVYFNSVLENLTAAVAKNAFVSRKDQMRAAGYLAYYQKNWPLAVRRWEVALAEDPSDAQLKNDLEALKTLTKRRREREAVRELASQAETYEQTGLLAQAVTAWESVLQREPAYPGARESLAVARVALEKERQKVTLKKMMERGVALYQEGDYAQAAEVWLESLQIDPSYKEARVWMRLVGKKLTGAATPVPAASIPARPASLPTMASKGEVDKAEELFRQGLVFYVDDNLPAAIKKWKEALSHNSQMKRAREALKHAEAELSFQ